ncbi:hypothetical protein PoB_004344500 [Plakobranchus ocellatus]|uniref:Cadherin domain-containing protein n=1 Tax=Plakobranchus ocellatus TaxID=259542 RepID=A0AAV4BBN0_9GAST|nr:hypothetical protein PoB_004344500 [Plakobranchus ocellatus]
MRLPFYARPSTTSSSGAQIEQFLPRIGPDDGATRTLAMQRSGRDSVRWGELELSVQVNRDTDYSVEVTATETVGEKSCCTNVWVRVTKYT